MAVHLFPCGICFLGVSALGVQRLVLWPFGVSAGVQNFIGVFSVCLGVDAWCFFG